MNLESVVRLHLIAVLITVGMSILPTSVNAAYDFEKFLGEYIGEGISHTDGVLTKRDLEVDIKPKGNGFVLTWVSVTHDGGKVKRKAYTIHFKPTKTSGLYGSGMRTDMFGNHVPMDPLKGEPYVWSRIIGDTLFVYALLITEAGGYEIQTYERTLAPGGLDLKYSSVRDGVVTKTVEGKLKRIE